VADIIGTIVDEHRAKTTLCAPFPDEPSDPDAIEKIIACTEQNIDGLRQVGHNVILPTLALRAFQQMPETITPSRVNGLCKLIESFTRTLARTERPHILWKDEKPEHLFLACHGESKCAGFYLKIENWE
jgi:hypothetical protein